MKLGKPVEMIMEKRETDVEPPEPKLGADTTPDELVLFLELHFLDHNYRTNLNHIYAGDPWVGKTRSITVAQGHW